MFSIAQIGYEYIMVRVVEEDGRIIVFAAVIIHIIVCMSKHWWCLFSVAGVLRRELVLFYFCILISFLVHIFNH
jgi:hypothetical protein